MAVLQHTSELDFSGDRIRQWLKSSGADARLNPAFLGGYPGTKNLQWRSTVAVEDLPGGRARVTDYIEHQHPESANELFAQALRYRAAQLESELRFADSLPETPPLTVAVSGSHGMVGEQLCALLETLGHKVRRLVRGQDAAQSPQDIVYDAGAQEIELDKLAECDAIINLAGESIFGFYNEGKKQRISTSRIMPTRTFMKALERLSTDGRKRVMVSASAVGYYGAHASHGANPPLLAEDNQAGADVLARTCMNWEHTGTSDLVRTVNLRFGLIITPAGGILGTLLPLATKGVLGPMGEYLWMSWVSQDDVLHGLMYALLTESCSGPYNLVAGQPVTNEEFTALLCAGVGTQPFAKIPSFGPKLLLGREGARSLALASQRVSQEKLVASGFRFRFNDLAEYLNYVLPFSQLRA